MIREKHHDRRSVNAAVDEVGWGRDPEALQGLDEVLLQFGEEGDVAGGVGEFVANDVAAVGVLLVLDEEVADV